MPTPSGRARPLSRDDRRAAIVAATVPLVMEFGAAVTTRQIAVACGVAEGTLFRAFADKDEILRAVMHSVWDPAPLLADLDRFTPDDSLESRVLALVSVLAERQRLALGVSAAAHQLWRSSRSHAGEPESADHRERPHEEHSQAMARIVEVIAASLASFQGQLRLPERRAARILFFIVLGNSLSTLSGSDRLTDHEIADVVLHGIAAQGDPLNEPNPCRPVPSSPSETTC